MTMPTARQLSETVAGLGAYCAADHLALVGPTPELTRATGGRPRHAVQSLDIDTGIWRASTTSLAVGVAAGATGRGCSSEVRFGGMSGARRDQDAANAG
jgi:hypothetical protein